MEGRGRNIRLRFREDVVDQFHRRFRRFIRRILHCQTRLFASRKEVARAACFVFVVIIRRVPVIVVVAASHRPQRS